MAENMTSFSGAVGTVAVTTVNSMPPNSGTYVPATDPAGTGGQVKMTPSNVVFQNSSNVVVGSGETPLYTPNTDSSSFNCNNYSTGLTPQVDAISVIAGQQQSPGGVVSVDGANIIGPPPATGTLPVAAAGVKKTSFQITSVTVDSSASNDGGDDSADDLDESHTEDSSDVATDVSRHTSESRGTGGTHTANDDNFTRNDIFYNPAPPSSMNIAPVIPTSSQYGLAIVPEGLNPVTEAPPPAPAIMNDPVGDKADDKDIVHNRFKVVKIVSTEPFKKGRWMCMDYFDHTTTTSGTTAVKDTTQPQPTQQSIPQSQTHTNIQQPMQSNAEKVPSNTVNVQGSNVPMTSSPPQASTILQQDSQQQATIVQQNQPQHVIQTQMQSNMHDQDGNMNSSGLPNGNGTHYHVNDGHNVQGVYMNHVAPSSSVMNSNVTDTSAFSSPMPNHNPNIPSAGNTFQGSISQQQQQQQYYNNSGVMAGMPPRPVSVAPTPSITTQQQQTMAAQQPSMNSQQTSRPLTGQVPIVHSQTQPQTLGQIGPQSSISQNTSVPILSQTMSASQMHQAPVQVTQPSHLPAQSLPHGAHAQMTGSGSISNTPAGGTTAPQQQQQHAAQSLGHNMLQQNKPAFMNQPQHQQSQVQTQNQFQQQANSQQQQLMQGSQQSVMGGQQSSSQQNPGQISQNSSNQQTQQPQNYQAGVMMQNIPGLQQQVHVQQMSTPGQHNVQMQQGQPNAQTQGMYNSPGQMMGHSMPISGQSMNMQQNTQPLMQQQNVIQNQNMMQQQAQIVGQQHHQQMMNMPPQQQSMVSQTQAAAPPQPIMTQPQMMSQMMQNTQMSGMVTQTPLVSQPGIPQQQGIMPSQTNLPQPNMMQQMPQQPNYTSQTQPQTINNQPSMQQPVMQPYPQPQPNPMAQQQQMLPPQSQSNIMTPQMAQSINQGQQMPIQQQSGQQNQPQPAPQQQQQQPQVNIPSQPQQTVFQNTSQQMQVSQGNVAQNMTNLQSVHNIMPPSSQSIAQLSTSTGMQMQSNDSTNSNVTAPNTEPPPQQPQSIVQQQQPVPVSVPNVSQVQSNAPAAPSPEIHHTHTSQSQPITSQIPPLSTTASSTAPAITSLSAAATVIIDGVNSLGDSTAGGNGNEDGESATGTNTVAIDNKIEQAMDLVKSHLMFAVREEVEVLKEKISELMERITQLEYENSILRANASQETLAQLQKSTQHPAPNVNEGHQGFS